MKAAIAVVWLTVGWAACGSNGPSAEWCLAAQDYGASIVARAEADLADIDATGAVLDALDRLAGLEAPSAIRADVGRMAGASASGPDEARVLRSVASYIDHNCPAVSDAAITAIRGAP